MTDADDGRVTCPACGKQYRWKAEIAGRKVRCKCGQVLAMPQQAPVASDGGYDLALPDDPPAGPQARTGPSSGALGPGRCPSCGSEMKPGAVLCLNCGYHTQSGQKVRTSTATGVPASGPPGRSMVSISPKSAVAEALDARVDDAGAARVKDLYLPLGLIALGVIMTYVQMAFFGAGATTGYLAAGVQLLLTLVVSVPLYLMAIIVTARLMGVSFGPLGIAIIKIMAIALGPNAVGQILAVLVTMTIDEIGLVGAFVGWFVSLVLYFVLLSALFDLDLLETFVCVAVVWVLQMAIGTAIAAMAYVIYS